MLSWRDGGIAEASFFIRREQSCCGVFVKKSFPTRFVSYGLGEIGSAVARLALERGMKMVGAIDIHPDKKGRDAGEVVGVKKLGVVVSDDARLALAAGPDVVFHATVSSLREAAPQIIECVRAGAAVVSTCEELVGPTGGNKLVAKRIDAEARRKEVVVAAIGVNPGFVMDFLPVVLANACRRVDSVFVRRVVDAGKRRKRFQKKIGAGLSLNEARKKAAGLGHHGLRESAEIVAAGLGRELGKVTESKELVVRRGRVTGVRQSATGFVGGKPFVVLEFLAALGARDADLIRLSGDPGLEVVVRGGVHGDSATAALVVNAVPRVLAAKPGLRNVLELAAPAPGH